MTKLPPQLSALNDAILTLGKAHSFTQAQAVVDAVTALLGIDTGTGWKPFTDSQGKIRSNAGWFMEAEGFADRRAVYKIGENGNANLDLKAYWTHKTKKSVISWLVALTPNFEDEPFYQAQNVGIDFIIPEKADRVIVVLSKNYVIRTMELQGQLSVTQQEIFAKWQAGFDFSNKAQVHELLWQSFDIEPLNKRFYKEISSLFIELEQHLAKTKLFDERHAAYFANRLIGRILFCWFLDKKGLINPEAAYFDPSGMNATDYYHGKLETLFFKVFNTPQEERGKNVERITPYLNGGLFEPKEGDKFGNPSLTFPADYFDRLIGLLRHYNFTTDESTSTFQQVAIDPEMLGRIFENLLAEQVEETGEQARKAKGAFYTPREIVDYMCRESLREYLKSKLPELEDRDQRIGQLLDSKEHEWRDQQRNFRQDLKPYKHDILKALEDLKVIDPACGSGAFPMGMLHMLLQVYERLEPDFDPYKKKLSIIRENLYGVDIEPMAVEISRLRAWLSIVVDEEKVEPLPNLDFKFVCANSLIPLEKKPQSNIFDTIGLDDEIQQIRTDYYSTNDPKQKTTLRKKFGNLLEAKSQQGMWTSGREKQLLTYRPFDAENVTGFFDPIFMFGISAFDIVIANPPYIDSENMVKNQNELRNFISNTYTMTRGNWDMYIAFFELGFNTLNDQGVLTFITPDKWIVKPFGDQLRINKFDNMISILRSGRDVFENVNVDSIVTLFSNKKTGDLKVHELVSKKIIPIAQINKKMLESPFLLDFLFSKHLRLLLKIDAAEGKFSDLSVCENACATSDAYELKKIIYNLSDSSVFKKNKHYKIINTGTVDKYLSKWGHKEMTYLKDKYLYPVANKNDFINLFANSYAKKTISPKLIIKGLTLMDACIDLEGIIVPGKTTLIVAEKKIDRLKYLASIINSKLVSFYINEKYSSSSYNGGVNFTKDMVNNLPIPKLAESKQKPFIVLIDKILSVISKSEYSHKKHPIEQIELEEQIDNLVFDLYGLTKEEREIVLQAS